MLGRPKVADNVRKFVLDARSDGFSIRKIAEIAGVSVGTVHRIIKDTAEPAQNFRN